MEEQFCTPTPKDILGGRGRAILRHQGNVIFRKVIEKNSKMYLYRFTCNDRVTENATILTYETNAWFRYL